MTYQIIFADEKTEYRAEEGMTVLDAQIAAGLRPDAFCGGKGTCGKCSVTIDGETVLACRTVIDRDMVVYTGRTGKEHTQILMKGTGRQIRFLPGELPGNLEAPLFAAVDVGSTTVVVYLLDGRDGRQLGAGSRLNPQRQYGADVVSRCSYAMENGAEILSGCIRRTVDELLQETARRYGREPEEIVRIVMVGNSCMHHLFLEIPTKTLVLAPYTPAVTEAVSMKASDCQISIHPQGELLWLPNIGGFVGSDTVGCVLASGLDQAEETTLLVDIGTNGEIVLGDRNGMTACSTAAGPAFEGAKITCGMRGSEGAIDHVYLEEGKIKFHVIGDGEPAGICGSGLLDAAACFLKAGIMDETGRLPETYYFTDRVFLNQQDIRELQLAKAAIAAGIRSLCLHRKTEVTQIRKLMIAGAFGNYLNPDSACAIGMLPAELRDRISSIGNAAGEGAQIAALNVSEYEHSLRLREETEFLELALDPGFQDIYVDELGFPEEEMG